MQNDAAKLQKDNVIPDVLPESTSLPYSLIVEWPETKLDVPGLSLDREQTQTKPSLQVNPVINIATAGFPKNKKNKKKQKQNSLTLSSI